MLGLKFHHFGLAARDAERAAEFVRLVGYECGTPVVDPLQNVVLRWCEKVGAPSVEIISPTGTHGPLSGILASQPTSFYHICYEIEVGTNEMLGSMRAHGLRVATVAPPQPAVLFGGRHVSFHVVNSFGLIELLEPGFISHS